MGDLTRSNAPVPYAALAPQFIARLLKGDTLRRGDFFAVGAIPSNVISYIRNHELYPVRTTRGEPRDAVEWDMRDVEIAAAGVPALREKQRAGMQKQAARRKQKAEAQRDIKALRKQGHPIPESLKHRANMAVIKSTDGISTDEF